MVDNNPSHHPQPGERGQAGSEADASAPPAPRGGVGGQSGTGQATPHRGLTQPGGDAALDQTLDGAAPTRERVPSDQSGGTQQDRAQKDEERKANENTSASPTHGSGAADPAPGTPRRENP